MKTTFTLLLLLVIFAYAPDERFLAEQQKYERVRTAVKEKGNIVTERLQKAGLQTHNFNLLLVAYKTEDVIEVYVKKQSATRYAKLASYAICARSGSVGPKRKAGDSQVPEGFYYIDRFNPSSSYYLSLGLNYPNLSDKRKSTAMHLGGDIFIHGSCVTIGCMPMTNDLIQEIYLYAVHAKNNGQHKIPVYIFPFRMTEQNMNTWTSKYKDEPILIDFWKNIRPGYTSFEKNHVELNPSVDAKGDYQFKD